MMVILVVSLGGCYYDNFEELKAGNLTTACDTLDSTGAVKTISFANEVQPILNASCGSNNDGCHSANGNGSLADYAGVSTSSNSLMDRIKHSSNISSGSWMPPNGPKLDDCSISKISIWINQGKQNN